MSKHPNKKGPNTYARRVNEDRQMYGIQRALKHGSVPKGGPSQVHALGGSPIS